MLQREVYPEELGNYWRLVARWFEIDVEPLMPALVRLRAVPELLGVSLRSGSLRLYAADSEKLIAQWRENWPFPDLRLLGERWVEPDMEDVFTAYSQGYDGILKKPRSEEHTSELQSRRDLVCRLLLEKKNINNDSINL